MAAPWDYASSVYLALKVTLSDGTLATIKVDRYLNNGLKNPRNANAEKAKDALLNAIATELKAHYPGPLVPTIDGLTYDRLKLQRVFAGKGAPEDIRNVVKLASRFKLINDKMPVDKYVSTNMGLDCNGFAGNFWGIDPNTPIGKYNVNRRKAVADIVAGDAMLWYKKSGGEPFHIGVVDEVIVVGKQFQIIVAQSMGPVEDGLMRFDWGKFTPENNKSGELFAQRNMGAPIGECVIYFAGGPTKGKSNM
jgi:hypothetical protein